MDEACVCANTSHKQIIGTEEEQITKINKLCFKTRLIITLFVPNQSTINRAN